MCDVSFGHQTVKKNKNKKKQCLLLVSFLAIIKR